jgi:osmoprotectant transport system ATP-binding protein
MDEPFGAIDPITRNHLQNEFLKILHALKKTIVFVTHDIDEALKVGDRIAILRDGALVQYDTPEALLTRPANAFVESFVGADRALKRLALVRADTACDAGVAPGHGHQVAGAATLREALALMLALGVDNLGVVDAAGAVQGVVTLAAIRARTVRP